MPRPGKTGGRRAVQMEIRYLKGVGEKRAALLQKLGIHCVEDLLEFYPRDYVDYSKPYPVERPV